jgi:serine/threonine protein kinase
MESALAPNLPPSPIAFHDGLGERRRMTDGTGADNVELLYLRGELTAIPSFEFALRERAGRLANFRHTYYGRVRSVDRLNDPGSTLTVVSDSTRGVRLANLLSQAERPVTLDINASLHLLRQLVSAVAMLHENAGDLAHGAIGPERIVVTPNARVVIVEYVLGAALEQLRFSPERYWKELRVALPASSGPPRFDQRADVTQIGVVGLSLILGRLLHEDEYPSKVRDVLASAWAISARGGLEPLPPGLRAWLARALQLDARHSFASALDARAELDKVLSGEDEIGDGDEYSALIAAVPEPRVEPEPEPEPELEPERAPIVVVAPPTPQPQPSSQPAPESEALPVFAAMPAPQRESYRQSPSERDPEPHAVVVVATPPPPLRPYPQPRLQPPPPLVVTASIDDEEPEHEMAQPRTPTRGFGRVAAAVVGLLALSVGGAFAARRYLVPPAHASATGQLSINSTPAGAAVLVDGVANGVTPVTLTLKTGDHLVELRGSGEPRTIPVSIAAGAQMSQYVELPGGATGKLGQLQVRTEPAGAQVSVDGIARGKSPVLVVELTPGQHLVVLESDLGTIKQNVAIEAATTASLVVPLAAAEGAPVSGWISVSAPVDLQLFENKKLLGTSQTDRIMVAAGRHDIEIVNEPLGYRVVRTIQVPPGKIAPIKLDWPSGTIALNAVPWAEVWIDGAKVGETPIGNLSLPIGPHEIVFRHPDLGELRHAATVTVNTPARVSVDLRKKP